MEKNYNYILNSPIMAYAHHKILLDKEGLAYDYEFLEINSTFEKITGLKGDIINKTVREVIPGIENSDFNWIELYGDISLNGGETSFEQYSEPLKKWYRVYAYSTEKFYFTTMFIDISESKSQMEELENFFTVNLDLLCIADFEGNFIKTNKAWSEILGYSTTELNKRKFLEFVHPEDIEGTLAAMKNLGKGEEVLDFTNRYLCKDGSYKHIEWRSHPKGNYIYAAARDITERIKMEEELIISEKEKNLILNGMQGVYIELLDKDMNVLFVNDEVKKRYNVQNLKEKVHCFEFIRGLSSPCPNCTVKKAIETQEIQSGEIVDNLGTTFLAKSTPIFNQDGEIIKIIHFWIDISEMKKAQEKLIEAKEIAEKASKAKSEFLSNMSHEIRTPLNAVIGFTDMLMDTKLNPVQKEFVENANISGHTLLGIINDILDFSKIEAGMMHLEMIKTDIIEIMSNSIDIVRHSAEKKGLELLLNIDSNAPRFAITDPIRLKQILANILGNAIKFTKEGEIELKLIYEKIDDSHGKFNFSIRDTGIGISQIQKDRLFKAFSQADSSTTREFGGTGLGLIISDMIIQKMGGQIDFTSETGKGTTFFFDLSTEIEYGEAIDLSLVNKIKNCLVIDDNYNNRLILSQILSDWDIKVETCDSAFEALKIIEKSASFDLIICDYHMPYIDGLETIKLIREKLGLTPDKQPIILLHSSSDNSEFHNKCNELGVLFRLVKPVKSDDLLSYLCNIYTKQNELLKKPNCFCECEVEENCNKDECNEDIKILIVEDVPMNMILIKSLLTKFYPNITILEANNGLNALELYKKSKPDIILMDVQMPEMDGIQATREIRSLEKDLIEKTIIIALTAGVFKEEKDKCINAGMDDFLSKPIRKDKIQETLSKYIKNKGNKHFNKAALLEKFDGDEEVLEKLVKEAKESIPIEIQRLYTSILDRDVESLRNKFQVLKELAINMEFTNLARILVEFQCAEEDFTLLQKEIIELEDEWELIEKFLK